MGPRLSPPGAPKALLRYNAVGLPRRTVGFPDSRAAEDLGKHVSSLQVRFRKRKFSAVARSIAFLPGALNSKRCRNPFGAWLAPKQRANPTGLNQARTSPAARETNPRPAAKSPPARLAHEVAGPRFIVLLLNSTRVMPPGRRGIFPERFRTKNVFSP